MLRRLDHVIIAVRDLEAATATYVRLLGRSPSWKGVHPGYGSANTLFRLDDLYVELLTPAGEGAIGTVLSDFLAREGEGLFALAFETADAAGAAAWLREKGFTVPNAADGSGRVDSTGKERSWRNVIMVPEEARGIRLLLIEHRSPADSLPPAQPTGDPDASIVGIDHVVITSADPDAARSLWRDRLELRLALDRTFEQWGMRLLFFRLAGVTIEVAHAIGSGNSEAPDRLWGISWRTGDVARARDRLAREGFDVSEVRPGRRPGTEVCTVRRETHGVATLVLGSDPVARSVAPA
jgi:catechol 2,3-dioxygenase-like lactoylglutathione lyase family enzyme